MAYVRRGIVEMAATTGAVCGRGSWWDMAGRLCPPQLACSLTALPAFGQPGTCLVKDLSAISLSQDCPEGNGVRIHSHVGRVWPSLLLMRYLSCGSFQLDRSGSNLGGSASVCADGQGMHGVVTTAPEQWRYSSAPDLRFHGSCG